MLYTLNVLQFCEFGLDKAENKYLFYINEIIVHIY